MATQEQQQAALLTLDARRAAGRAAGGRGREHELSAVAGGRRCTVMRPAASRRDQDDHDHRDDQKGSKRQDEQPGPRRPARRPRRLAPRPRCRDHPRGGFGGGRTTVAGGRFGVIGDQLTRGRLEHVRRRGHVRRGRVRRLGRVRLLGFRAGYRRQVSLGQRREPIGEQRCPITRDRVVLEDRARALALRHRLLAEDIVDDPLLKVRIERRVGRDQAPRGRVRAGSHVVLAEPQQSRNVGVAAGLQQDQREHGAALRRQSIQGAGGQGDDDTGARADATR